jgi:hypothetical protein
MTVIGALGAAFALTTAVAQLQVHGASQLFKALRKASRTARKSHVGCQNSHTHYGERDAILFKNPGKRIGGTWQISSWSLARQAASER